MGGGTPEQPQSPPRRGSGLSTSATPLLWVGAYPLVTLLLRLTLLAYPLRPTYQTVARYEGGGTEWG